MQRYQFSRGFNIPISDVYAYYSDIESYVHRYPLYYSKIDVIHRSEKGLSTKQLIHISLDEYEDHVNVDVEYTFVPLKEIQYEIKGYGEGAIKTGIRFRDKDTVTYQCVGEINHVPLDIMNYAMENMERGTMRQEEYTRMLNYLLEQDLEHLENKRRGWKNGDSCNNCGKGKLEFTGKKEDSGIRKIEELKCDSCGAEFSNQRIESRDTITFRD
jgi:hypothetical protein